MSLIYEPAPAYIHEMAAEIFVAFHPELQIKPDEYPRLCILMASSSDKQDSDPLKLHGVPCAAVISVIPYKQRVDKRADAEIIIDEKKWESFGEKRRQALIDHEITHLEIQKDSSGFVITDDEGRPKLKLRQHSWELSGFLSIAQRYGNDAIEVSEMRDFEASYGEVVLPKEALF